MFVYRCVAFGADFAPHFPRWVRVGVHSQEKKNGGQPHVNHAFLARFWCLLLLMDGVLSVGSP
jgi:hypothetical protein